MSDLVRNHKGFLGPAQLICAFVFAYAKSRFSHDAAHLFMMKLPDDPSIIMIDNLHVPSGYETATA